MPAFCTIAAFWLARAVFARGGVRTVVTAVAWMAIGVVLVALAAVVAYFKFALDWALVAFVLSMMVGFGAQVWFIVGVARTPSGKA